MDAQDPGQHDLSVTVRVTATTWRGYGAAELLDLVKWELNLSDLDVGEMGFDISALTITGMAQVPPDEAILDRLLDALQTIEAADSTQSGAYGRASRDAVDLISSRVLGRKWVR